MATRAEQQHAAEQRRRRGAKTRAGRTKPGVAPEDRSRDKKHAARKATYALEESENGRPSRKSTRKSANRSKPDSNLTAREALQKGTPTARFRKARAKARRRVAVSD